MTECAACLRVPRRETSLEEGEVLLCSEKCAENWRRLLGRQTPCRANHPLARSSWRKRSSGRGGGYWRCLDCELEQFRERAKLPLRSIPNRVPKQEEFEVAGKGHAPKWAPGLGHCELPQGHPEQEHVQKAMTSKPSSDTAYILTLCNGRPGQPACPLKAQCLRWAKDQPLFEGYAGGEVFTLKGPAVEAVA